MSNVWNGFRDLFVDALELLHSLFRFVGDEPAWGFAIIALTLVVRVLLLPLAIKQTRSMRAMQQLQPQIKAIQKKYKADRELLRKDPERYKAQRQKMNEEMTRLYQDSGVNPAGGCLPLIAQAPIFIALFSVLRADMFEHAGTPLGDLLRSDFYFFTPGCPSVLAEGVRCGLSTGASDAGIWGYVLIVLMAGSMFYSQRQMMSRTAVTADSAQLQQQKILMYVMPVFLAFISFQFPMGVLLYWVTTNVWQIAQQAIILHEVEVAAPAEPPKDQPKGQPKGQPKITPGGASKGGSAGPAGRPPRKRGRGKGRTRQEEPGRSGTPGNGPASGKPKGPEAPPPSSRSDNGKSSGTGRDDHLPTRRRRDRG